MIVKVMMSHKQNKDGHLVFAQDKHNFWVIKDFGAAVEKGNCIDTDGMDKHKIIYKGGNPMRALAAYSDKRGLDLQHTLGDWAERHGYDRYTGERVAPAAGEPNKNDEPPALTSGTGG